MRLEEPALAKPRVVEAAINSEQRWIDAQAEGMHEAVHKMFECCGGEEEAEISADELHMAVDQLAARARGLACLAEAVDEAALHTGGAACEYVAQMARRARYITDLGYVEPELN